MDKVPFGEPFFSSGMAISVTLPVFGSNFPIFWSPKSPYYAMLLSACVVLLAFTKRFKAISSSGLLNR